jgi:hypothetical protein
MQPSVNEWFARLGYQDQLAAWLVASFLLYILASQIAWQYRYPGRDDGLGRLIGRVREQPFISWVGEATRLVYYLGIPFMAAINGLLRADLLGLDGTDWVPPGGGKSMRGFLWEDWVRGLGLVVALVLAMGGVWFFGRLASRRAGLTGVRLGIPGPAWQRLLGVLYDQVHWAFYRSGPLLWLDDPYWGVFAGLALVLLEAGLNPSLWWALKDPATAGPALIRLGTAWISALLFLATHNLWLTAAAHLALIGLLGWQEPEGHLYSDGATR